MVLSSTRRFSVSSLLTLSFLTAGTLIVLGALTAFWELNAMRRRAEFLYSVDRPATSVLRVRSDFLSFQQDLRVLSVSHDSELFQREAERLRTAFGLDLERAIRAVSELPAGAQRDTELTSLAAIRALFAVQVNALVSLAKAGDWNAVRLRSENRLAVITGLSESLVRNIDDIVEIEKKQVLEENRRAQVRAMWTVAVTGLLAILTIGMLGLAVAQNIAVPLGKLKEAVQSLGRGEFQQRVVAGGNDEIASLGEGFNRMASELGDLYKELRRSESHFRSLIENAADFILVVAGDGTVQYASPSCERVLGKSGTLAGKNIFEIVPGEEVPNLRSFLARRSENAAGESLIEFRVEADDGSYRVLEAFGNPLREETAGSGIVLNARDITERRRLEDQLRQSHRMEAIGTLAGGIAHDFNNLLTVIRGYSEQLLNNLANDPDLKKQAERIDQAAERASSLTGQLLAFSRRQILQPKVIGLNSLIVNLEHMLRRVIGEHIEMKTVLSCEVGLVKADPGQIEQVIMNLVVNAHDAMPDGGVLTLETENIELGERYASKHVGVSPGSYVMLAVSDTGSGMTPETVANIFDPFFTTKEIGKGTGLGLSTVYGIVKQSGGQIWVYSEPGHGSTFKIYLPRVSGQVDAPAPELTPSPDLPVHETILLVEDDPQVRDLAKTILTNRGYSVLCADNVVGVMALCEQHSGPIHLLLTDMVMPGINGRVLADQIRARKPKINVLYMSGYTPDAIVHHGVLEPGIQFLQKPFTPSMLTKKVREILDAGNG